jgi:hypothetical protein
MATTRQLIVEFFVWREVILLKAAVGHEHMPCQVVVRLGVGGLEIKHDPVVPPHRGTGQQVVVESSWGGEQHVQAK